MLSMKPSFRQWWAHLHRSPLGKCLGFAERNPYVASGCSCCMTLFLTDVAAQQLTCPGESWDSARGIAMATWGLVWYGGPQQMFWMRLYPWVAARFAMPGSAGSATIKTFLDCGVNNLVAYTPCFYLWTGFVKGYTLERSMELLKQEYSVACTGIFGFWTPVQFVNFYLMPPHLVTYVVQIANIVQKTWLSWLSNRTRVQERQQQESKHTSS